MFSLPFPSLLSCVRAFPSPHSPRIWILLSTLLSLPSLLCSVVFAPSLLCTLLLFGFSSQLSSLCLLSASYALTTAIGYGLGQGVRQAIGQGLGQAMRQAVRQAVRLGLCNIINTVGRCHYLCLSLSHSCSYICSLSSCLSWLCLC